MASAILGHLLQEIEALDPAELRWRMDSLDATEEAVNGRATFV